MKILPPVVLLLFVFLSAVGQGIKMNTTYITSENQTYHFDKNWLFIEADSPAFAEADFDDSNWKAVEDPKMTRSDTTSAQRFNGIGWFRLHIMIDSNVVHQPLAMSMSHLGASQVYIDGGLVKSYGKIGDSDNTVYDDPLEIPFIVTLNSPGEHVIAVRYANYNAEKNYNIFWTSFAGFQLRLGETDKAINEIVIRNTGLSTVLTLLGTIFFTLGIIHLFIFFFSRHIYLNLFFSLFTMGIAGLLTIAYFNVAVHYPAYQLMARYFIAPLAAVSCICLSGFIHALFIRKFKWLFYISIGLFILIIIFRVFNLSSVTITTTLALLTMVAFEAVVAIIWAIIHKVKGARILGMGLLFSALFILTIVALALTGSEIEISTESIGGIIMMVLLSLAIISIPLSISLYLAWNFGTLNKDLTLQLKRVKELSQKTLEQEQEKQKLLQIRQEELEEKVNERTEELRAEKKKSDDLLLNILPEEVAEELKRKGSAEARQYEHVTVLFADFVNFTHISEKLSPKDLVKEIDFCFKAFDAIIGKYELEKIKTIGDAYLAVCGLPEDDADHAVKSTYAALAIRDFIKNYQNENGVFDIRIGLHSGQVVAGIVGVKKFAYDIWGDTVNLAARMEQNCEPGQINISSTTYKLIKDRFNCRFRGKINAKNKGDVEMYFVDGVI